MEGRLGLLDRLEGLFGETCIAFPTVCDKTGDPVARSDKLGGDCGQRKVVGKAVSPAEKCVRRPPGPVIALAKNPIEAQALGALSSFTCRLEQVLKLGGLFTFLV